jgi:hypothetical protein
MVRRAVRPSAPAEWELPLLTDRCGDYPRAHAVPAQHQESDPAKPNRASDFVPAPPRPPSRESTTNARRSLKLSRRHGWRMNTKKMERGHTDPSTPRRFIQIRRSTPNTATASRNRASGSGGSRKARPAPLATESVMEQVSMRSADPDTCTSAARGVARHEIPSGRRPGEAR